MNHQKIVKASEVVGVDVKNMEGENLGSINDVVLDKMLGKVNYLVLDFGGVLGFGNKFFAVPWRMFSYDASDDCFILNVDKDRLKKAPGFDKDHWPNFTESDVSTRIDTYYQ